LQFLVREFLLHQHFDQQVEMLCEVFDYVKSFGPPL